MAFDKLFLQIALVTIDGVGPITAKKLVSHCGGVEAIFQEKKIVLRKIPGIGEPIIEKICSRQTFEIAEKELEFIQKHAIQTHYFLDENYPHRLKHVDDAPVLLFSMGNFSINATKTIAIVGTRKSTAYGNQLTNDIVSALKPFPVQIVSGLALGIDAAAHKQALAENIETVGVLAHGLNTIYPPQNAQIARKMVVNGGLITSYSSQQSLDPGHFPERNKIVAGMSDAVIVVESDVKGGALITANIAFEYNRDVYAVPGKVTDKTSAGCNKIIQRQVAQLLTSANELPALLGWTAANQLKNKTVQPKLFVDLNELETKIVGILEKDGTQKIDIIAVKSGIPLSVVSSTLFQLELKGVVKALPGTQYALI